MVVLQSHDPSLSILFQFFFVLLLFITAVTDSITRASLTIFLQVAPQPLYVLASVATFVLQVLSRDISGTGYSKVSFCLFFLQLPNKPLRQQLRKLLELFMLSLHSPRQWICSCLDRQPILFIVLREKCFRMDRIKVKLILSELRLIF